MDDSQLREIMEKQKVCERNADGKMPPHMKKSESGIPYCSLVTYDDALDIEDILENGGCGCMDPDTWVMVKDPLKHKSGEVEHPVCDYATDE